MNEEQLFACLAHQAGSAADDGQMLWEKIQKFHLFAFSPNPRTPLSARLECPHIC
jgi:hypothetical protein